MLIVNIQFDQGLYKKHIKEIAIAAPGEDRIYHWFVRSPACKLNPLPLLKRLYKHQGRNVERLRDNLSTKDTLEEVRAIVKNFNIVYATSSDTIKWLLDNVDCVVSGDLPPINELPTGTARCPIHLLTKNASSTCAYSIVSRTLDLLEY